LYGEAKQLLGSVQVVGFLKPTLGSLVERWMSPSHFFHLSVLTNVLMTEGSNSFASWTT